ncbi:MAG: 16S rRNA (guanine(527)-N(7))-methyltransferase RsmG [Erysipelotrichaceae bacterium]|nr:16S rRNA (guanine(527)-N(7))-methyltransferase RsmG [Erysipelotrichaceae bacterium]
MTKEEFISELYSNGLSLSGRQLEQLDFYAEYLKEYNEKINLTAITEYAEVLDRHFYDSLLGFFDLDMKGTLADIGTGAGFPGLVLKICYPQLKVTLVEPLRKRCAFLEGLIGKLDLEGVEIINERGEDYSLEHREEFDYVTARAVSSLNILIEVCGALVKRGGYFVALRGAAGNDEIKEASKAIRTMGFRVKEVKERKLFDGSHRVIGILKKTMESHKKYPRKYSIIKQKPL